MTGVQLKTPWGAGPRALFFPCGESRGDGRSPKGGCYYSWLNCAAKISIIPETCKCFCKIPNYFRNISDKTCKYQYFYLSLHRI